MHHGAVDLETPPLHSPHDPPVVVFFFPRPENVQGVFFFFFASRVFSSRCLFGGNHGGPFKDSHEHIVPDELLSLLIFFPFLPTPPSLSSALFLLHNHYMTLTVTREV